MIKKLALILSIAIGWSTIPAHAAQLNYGRYFGTIQMDGHPEVIAVSLDAFVTQGNDPAIYPTLDVILRVNLGGYLSPEYIGYDYHDPTFNFEKSVLSLNDSKNDLSATLRVTNTDSQTILEGPVVQRLTNSKGKIRLVMDLDDGAASLGAHAGQAPFLSVLRGEYRGTCGSHTADLQIETGRALQADAPGNALSGYSITGRLGFTDGPLCSLGQSTDLEFCSLYPYSTGTYSPFTNRITLQSSRGTLDCTKMNDELECVVNGFYGSDHCKLSKKSEDATGPVQIPTGVYMKVPSNLKIPLPAPLPPGNDDLIKALDGTFYGFLHYENRDQYQLMEMSVVASTSTENPHIQNRVLVEPTILLRLGNSWDSTPAQSLFLPQRVFFLSPGLSFQADGTDTFVVIGDWRTGYLSGVLYSRSYGRIGTFEMQKGIRPSIDPKMTMVAAPAGHFNGPQEASSPVKGFWSLDVDIPNDNPGPNVIGTPLRARYKGTNVMGSFESASLDLNTGALTFLIKNPQGDRLVIGDINQDSSLKLLWPAGPALGALMSAYQPFTYSSMATAEGR